MSQYKKAINAIQNLDANISFHDRLPDIHLIITKRQLQPKEVADDHLFDLA